MTTRGVARHGKCYTLFMPTARPRHMVTESDRLAEVLDVAAEMWPSERNERGALLRRVIEAGIETLQREAIERRKARIRAVNAAAGSFTGLWPAGWREESRDEWPA